MEEKKILNEEELENASGSLSSKDFEVPEGEILVKENLYYDGRLFDASAPIAAVVQGKAGWIMSDHEADAVAAGTDSLGALVHNIHDISPTDNEYVDVLKDGTADMDLLAGSTGGLLRASGISGFHR